MPYISENDRLTLHAFDDIPATQGGLNYLITLLIVRYVNFRGLRYATINDVLGALDGAGKEFYRRIAAPYEDQKREENGDVYPPGLWGLQKEENGS